MTRTARLKAFAKLNLGLRVLLKRPDGYHELRTVFQTISLADRIDVAYTPAAETRITIDGTPHIHDNLVEKAARLVLGELRLSAEVHFDLKKRIPAGAGLGGGSTDAAAVLLSLPVLAGKQVAEGRLFELANQLGSDVPFFLHGGTALGLGRGEELYPLPDQRQRRGLLVAPAIHSSTADAYRDLSERLTSIPLQNKLVSFQRQVWKGSGETAANDFEEVVFARHPELGKIRDRLQSVGAEPAAMTGSGSAIFGIFENATQFRHVLSQARTLFEGERTFPISFVSRAQYRSAWRRALASHIPQASKPNVKEDLWPPPSLYA
ncbi:MAG: 4-diphosphocytidyl-2-C-methyl-D-erythritol kinase [Bryobacterales bacterium]|jgi:4-diphosphocytidyl-2-C-methyl-D-erythritol kinase|nr:4-diphosphocytidyl-2-C-methyl-D-erythritol kinase [Bryobacterales bacterium]